jgi:hypothetical protein
MQRHAVLQKLSKDPNQLPQVKSEWPAVRTLMYTYLDQLKQVGQTPGASRASEVRVQFAQQLIDWEIERTEAQLQGKPFSKTQSIQMNAMIKELKSPSV